MYHGGRQEHQARRARRERRGKSRTPRGIDTKIGERKCGVRQLREDSPIEKAPSVGSQNCVVTRHARWGHTGPRKAKESTRRECALAICAKVCFWRECSAACKMGLMVWTCATACLAS